MTRMAQPSRTALMELAQAFVPRRRRYRRKTLAIFHLAANDLNAERITQLIAVPIDRVRKVMESARGKREIAQLRFRISGENPIKMFQKAVPESFQVQLEIMRDRHVKPSTRLEASKAIQNRALGMPKQEIDVNQKSNVRQVLEALQQERGEANQPIEEGFDIEAEWRDIQEAETISSERAVEVVQESADTTESEPMDDWVRDNL